MSRNTGGIRNFCCMKKLMALCATGLSECSLWALLQHLREFCTWTSVIGFSSITHTERFMFICFLYNPPIHKEQNLCVSRLLTLPADVILGSLTDYQLLCIKSTFNVRRIERNFLLSPMSIALLMHGNWDFTSSSIKTGAMFSPPAVIISSYKNA